MAAKVAIFSKDTFQFFRDLGKHNKKEWMDAHRRPLPICSSAAAEKIAGRNGTDGFCNSIRVFETTGRRGAKFLPHQTATFASPKTNALPQRTCT